MFTGLIQHIHKARFLLEGHSTTILTGVGVGGTVATAILTGRASFKASEILREESIVMGVEDEPSVNVSTLVTKKIELSMPTKIKLTWKYYLPPVATGVTTITCIIVANKISSKKIAALAVAGGISERALQEYKEKVVEKIGVRQSKAVRDEIAQDRVTNNPPNSQVVITGTGQVLCYDMLTGRYFQSSVEDIKRAENKINFILNNHMSASLSEFYEEIGLEPTTYTDSVGWGPNHRFEVSFTTTMSTDNRPCVAVDFTEPPHMEYYSVH